MLSGKRGGEEEKEPEGCWQSGEAFWNQFFNDWVGVSWLIEREEIIMRLERGL